MYAQNKVSYNCSLNVEWFHASDYFNGVISLISISFLDKLHVHALDLVFPVNNSSSTFIFLIYACARQINDINYNYKTWMTVSECYNNFN